MRGIADACRCAAAVALTLGLCAPPARAARPMMTDDARIVAPGACQLESWVRRNDDSTEYWALPACNFSGNLELTAGGARTHDAEGTRATDLVLQGKTLFKPLEPDGWGLGLALGTVRHPQLAGGRDWYGYVPASFAFDGERVVLHFNLGWLRAQATGLDRMTWGSATETRLDERNWLIAEAFGQNQGRPSYQFGLRHWLVPDRVQIDATYGNRFGGDTGPRWFSIGLRLLSAPLF
ncbi:MAG TPA: hypothetical protein VLX30_10425 [Burkholderiales bacterium]|nr:hypothetical protein [Burkholderiales bacterium]